MTYQRKVVHGKVNMNGSQYHNGLLRRLHGKTVELRGAEKKEFNSTAHGYDVYYRKVFICFIETWRG